MQASRNIVFCGFTEEDKKKIKIEDIRKINKYKKHTRFPYLVFVENISEARRHQGFLIVIKNAVIYSYPELDKKYRIKLKNFKYIIFCSNNGSRYIKFNPYSNFSILEEGQIYTNYFKNQIDYLYKLEIEKCKKYKPITQKQKEYIKKIKEYIKEKELVSTSDLAKYLNLSERSIQRYLNKMNEEYKNIGYSEKDNKWYMIK